MTLGIMELGAGISIYSILRLYIYNHLEKDNHVVIKIIVKMQ